MLGEFLQLFVHLGTQQLALTMLFLVTLVFVTVNFDKGVPLNPPQHALRLPTRPTLLLNVKNGE